MKTSFFCVDWGTTSLRIWKISAAGEVIAERRGNLGMSTIKPADFEAVLEREIAEMGRSDEMPVMICGMAGSAQGWKEAPYLDVPTPLSTISDHAVRAPTKYRDVRILPGIAQRDPARPDVARGEETLLLGALRKSGVDGRLCLPGTHSKWVTLERGVVTGFSTAMTGELYSLLSTHSTLSHFTTATHINFSGEIAFASAVKEALSRPAEILSLLFSVRSTPLLMGAGSIDDMSARLSGLLIGTEIAGMSINASNKVTLISGSQLAPVYSKALEIAGVEHHQVDAEEMVLVGLIHAAQSVWGEGDAANE